jgi:methylated-DNA-protein-cysteine methyltransferase related protein
VDTEAVIESALAREILRRVRSVPAGFVTTYGDLCPAAPRFAGAVMAACHDPRVPWQRVVRADGSLAKGARQRRLLEAEGIPFRGERVNMELARLPIEATGDDLEYIPDTGGEPSAMVKETGVQSAKR